MKIPRDPLLRIGFYQEVLEQCFASRTDRAAKYDSLRSYYLWGTDGSEMPLASKIYSHLDTLTSFLYSAETTRFIVELGEGADPREMPKTIALRNRLQDEWHDSTTDTLFGEALLWALVYDSMILYPVWRRGAVNTYLIEPWNFGVLREDVQGLSRQEAMGFRYDITLTQLLSDLEGHPKLEDIMRQIAVSGAQGPTTQLPSAVQRIITSSVSPNIVGQVPVWWNDPTMMLRPQIKADMATLEELWLWSDEDNDFRRVTMCNNVVIWDRENTFLPTDEADNVPGEVPFTQVCPNPQLGYFWGRSEIAHLVKLQEAWAWRLEEIRRLGDKIVDPPKLGMGFSADMLESLDALFDPHGFASVSEGANVKVENFAPQIPDVIWHEVDYLDKMFSIQSGITPIMQGYGESGVRSRGQTDTMARLGSSRTKKRAMLIEDALDRYATLMLKMIQRHDTTQLAYNDQGQRISFVASQFTPDFTVKVDAHSMSPIFVEDEKNLAFSMREAGLITPAKTIEMLHPSMQQEMLHDLKTVIEPQQQAAMAKEEQEKKLKAVK